MSRESLRLWHLPVMFIVAMVGYVLFTTDHAFAPVHEGFHGSAAFHDQIEVLGYTRTSTRVERLSLSIIRAGYWGELYFWTAVALILGRWGTLFAGYGLGSMMEAPVSMDFKVYMYDWALSETGSEATAQRVVDMNISQFKTVSAIALCLLGIRYGRLIWLAVKFDPVGDTGPESTPE